MESLARESAVFGDPINPLTTVAEIKAVTKSDLVRVATDMLKHKPAFAVMGNTNNEQSLHKAMTNWTPEANNKRLMVILPKLKINILFMKYSRALEIEFELQQNLFFGGNRMNDTHAFISSFSCIDSLHSFY